MKTNKGGARFDEILIKLSTFSPVTLIHNYQNQRKETHKVKGRGDLGGVTVSYVKTMINRRI